MKESDKGKHRTAQVFKEGEWVDVPFREIEKGDTFRLFEPDGTPNASGRCLALGVPRPKPGDEKVWSIDARPIEPTTENPE